MTALGYVLYNNVDNYNAILANSQREEHARAQQSKLHKTNTRTQRTTSIHQHDTQAGERRNRKKRKRSISSFLDQSTNFQKQRKINGEDKIKPMRGNITAITKDGTGAGTLQNKEPTKQLVQKKNRISTHRTN